MEQPRTRRHLCPILLGKKAVARPRSLASPGEASSHECRVRVQAEEEGSIRVGDVIQSVNGRSCIATHGLSDTQVARLPLSPLALLHPPIHPSFRAPACLRLARTACNHASESIGTRWLVVLAGLARQRIGCSRPLCRERGCQGCAPRDAMPSSGRRVRLIGWRGWVAGVGSSAGGRDAVGRARGARRAVDAPRVGPRRPPTSGPRPPSGPTRAHPPAPPPAHPPVPPAQARLRTIPHNRARLRATSLPRPACQPQHNDTPHTGPA